MTEQLLAMLFLAEQRNIRIRIVPAASRHRGVFGGPFRLFGYRRGNPLAYLDAGVGGLFVEDTKRVEGYRDLNRRVADTALDPEESRVLLAKLADEYDRSEGGWDVAQEHL